MRPLRGPRRPGGATPWGRHGPCRWATLSCADLLRAGAEFQVLHSTIASPLTQVAFFDMDNTVIRSNIVKPYVVLRTAELVRQQGASLAPYDRCSRMRQVLLTSGNLTSCDAPPQSPPDVAWFVPVMLLRVLLYLALDSYSRTLFNQVFYRLYQGRDASNEAKVRAQPFGLQHHPPTHCYHRRG